ncbi:xylulokinase [Dokdonia ponticola]|uniref:Xylulokinase n=1 Tax=Dokdonia ponticola TaxID=2041041 RepID=A0ABV9HVQ6_9FLAO
MYYLGLDIGSSSVKVALVEASTGKNMLSVHEPSTEMEMQSVQPDWAEQDPETWWRYACIAIKRVILETSIDTRKIAAIGISYQMHGLVIVDEQGRPLRPAIIWCDSRAVDIGKKAFQDLGEKKCAEQLLNSPGNFTASKLKWVKDYEPVIYNKIHKYMLPGDYIAYKLTGEINTTRNGLSEGTLWDYKNECVADWLLAYYDIDTHLTPPVVKNFTTQGMVTPNASKETGLPVGIPITYRAGDQPNNALTLGVFNPGQVAVTGGTSGVIYAVTQKATFNEIRKVNHFAHVNYSKMNPTVGRLLNINGAGIQFRWLLKNTAASSYQEMNKKADSVPVGSDGLVLLPFGNGAERMFENQMIGSQIKHLNLNRHQDAHLYRAALEGIAFSFVYGMELLKKDKTMINELRAGNDNLFRSAIFSTTIATLINQEIKIYNTTGAVGAARAAGLLDGDFDTYTKNINNNDYVMSYHPSKNITPYQKAYQHWRNELEMTLKSI